MTWIRNKYFCTVRGDRWTFTAGIKPYRGRYILRTLFKATSVAIKRHIKIRADANPYNPKYKEYFAKRNVHAGEYEQIFGG